MLQITHSIEVGFEKWLAQLEEEEEEEEETSEMRNQAAKFIPLCSVLSLEVTNCMRMVSFASLTRVTFTPFAK